MGNIREIVDKVKRRQDITLEEFRVIMETASKEEMDYLASTAREVADSIYGKNVYVRGLIEFTNYCRNDCYYCGIRRSNKEAERYRLTEEQIMECCQMGYELGFRTFVLQGGEDPYFTDDRICEIIRNIKNRYEDCAITLSIGEKSRASYERYFEAGADRYLLRHETANECHYRKLHPAELSLENRKRCLWNLKEIGYQVGAGFMVGTPGQTMETLYEDIRFIKELQPHMVGIGPFIPQHSTPFKGEKAGTLEETLKLLSIIRLIHPKVLLPATTALGTIHPMGREKGILAGANVVMPNLSPVSVRKKYELYDNKICTGDVAAEWKNCLPIRMEKIGYTIPVDRGDSQLT